MAPSQSILQWRFAITLFGYSGGGRVGIEPTSKFNPVYRGTYERRVVKERAAARPAPIPIGSFQILQCTKRKA